jgi:hypothetical protein
MGYVHVHGAAEAEAARRRVLQALKSAGATSSARALSYAPGNKLERDALKRLMAANVVRQEPSGGYWLDEQAQATLAASNAQVVRIVLLAVFAVLLIGVLVAVARR